MSCVIVKTFGPYRLLRTDKPGLVKTGTPLEWMRDWEGDVLLLERDEGPDATGAPRWIEVARCRAVEEARDAERQSSFGPFADLLCFVAFESAVPSSDEVAAFRDAAAALRKEVAETQLRMAMARLLAERLAVQLAGCSVEAQGGTTVELSDFGWSPSLLDVRRLRERCEKAEKELAEERQARHDLSTSLWNTMMCQLEGDDDSIEAREVVLVRAAKRLMESFLSKERCEEASRVIASLPSCPIVDCGRKATRRKAVGFGGWYLCDKYGQGHADLPYADLVVLGRAHRLLASALAWSRGGEGRALEARLLEEARAYAALVQGDSEPPIG